MGFIGIVVTICKGGHSAASAEVAAPTNAVESKQKLKDFIRPRMHPSAAENPNTTIAKVRLAAQSQRESPYFQMGFSGARKAEVRPFLGDGAKFVYTHADFAA